MDVLSEVLRVVRLSGAIHFCAEFTRPWAILTSPPEMLASRLVPGAEAVIPFHIATAGGAGCPGARWRRSRSRSATWSSSRAAPSTSWPATPA